MPPAIQGQRGSDDCYLVAQALVRGFDLSDDAAWPIIKAYNQQCVPPFSEKELRHKLKSARDRSKKAPGYLRKESRAHSSAPIATKEPEPPISQEDYTAVATAFLTECGGTFHGIDDVRSYLGRRKLVVEGERAGLVGIPGQPREIIKRLGQHFTVETLEAAGLWDFARCRFPYSTHKLIIPWRSLDGRVHVLQRRHLDQEGTGKDKYVFPDDLPALYPFGVEALRDAPKGAPIVFAEGALDVLAIRTIRNWRGMEYAKNMVPLGVPGSGWRPSWGEYTKDREVWIALDADKKGEELTQAVAQDCRAKGAQKATRWRPPAPCKDWAQFLVEASK